MTRKNQPITQPVHIMVFGVAKSDGDVMPLSIGPHDLRLNTESYIKYLEDIVLTWIDGF